MCSYCHFEIAGGRSLWLLRPHRLPHYSDTITPLPHFYIELVRAWNGQQTHTHTQGNAICNNTLSISKVPCVFYWNLPLLQRAAPFTHSLTIHAIVVWHIFISFRSIFHTTRYNTTLPPIPLPSALSNAVKAYIASIKRRNNAPTRSICGSSIVISNNIHPPIHRKRSKRENNINRQRNCDWEREGEKVNQTKPKCPFVVH